MGVTLGASVTIAAGVSDGVTGLDVEVFVGGDVEGEYV